MKLRKTRTMVRVLSMVLVVAMLLSAMMVQAFAYGYTINTTWGGNPVYASVGFSSTSKNFYCEMSYGVNAGMGMTLYGQYKDHSTQTLLYTVQRTGETYGYEYNLSVGSDHGGFTVGYQGWSDCWIAHPTSGETWYGQPRHYVPQN